MLRRLLVASATATVAGVTATLGLAAAADAWLGPGVVVLVALAAVWVPQTLIAAHLAHLRTRRPR